MYIFDKEIQDAFVSTKFVSSTHPLDDVLTDALGKGTPLRSAIILSSAPGETRECPFLWLPIVNGSRPPFWSSVHARLEFGCGTSLGIVFSIIPIIALVMVVEEEYSRVTPSS